MRGTIQTRSQYLRHGMISLIAIYGQQGLYCLMLIDTIS
jgi:hypothetical protein